MDDQHKHSKRNSRRRRNTTAKKDVNASLNLSPVLTSVIAVVVVVGANARQRLSNV